MHKKTDKTTTANRRFQAAALLAGVLLVTTALAGCTSAQATASSLQVHADERATDWDPGAQLVLILGTEGTFQMQSMFSEYEQFDSDQFDEVTRQDFWGRVEDDPDPGDGKAEFWLYVYRAGEGDGHLIVVVDRDKKVIYDDEVEGEDLGSPVGEYNVDSDQAMSIAMEESGSLSGAKGTDHFAFVAGLFREDPDENPAWLIAGGGGSSEGGGGGMIVIDAVTGDVLQEQGGTGDPADWY